MNAVVIVESPAKAKTINDYLGRDYTVLASFGHVRDLPAKDGSVDPDQDFAMSWEVDAKAAKRLADIARAVKDSDKVILATDPDREGEAISWHVLEVLRGKRLLKDKTVERVTFNAITKAAVRDAIAHPREIDQALVEAYLARRALDYLVGFTLSPVLWRKLPGARSAGRVQSVSLRLVCDREREIETFVTREYWSLIAHLRTAQGAAFEARLVGADGKRITRLDVGTGTEAADFKAALDSADFTVTSVEAKPAKRHPYPPFRTSTLQQDASRKLGLSPARTMQIAQRLYEGVEMRGETAGLITYMRTDGIDMAPEAIANARNVIADLHGPRYVPQVPRKYTAKAKNAQEAHEAIRPTDMGRLPKDVARFLEPEQARLYELIWKRTVASQMESAELERTTVDIGATAAGRRLELRASGQVIKFDGFLALYQDDEEDGEEAGRLPAMAGDERLGRDRIVSTQHFTEPPPRYTEEALIKRMEELGIGRPSTYAATLATLKDRDYVRLEKKKLVPEDKGRLVTAFLQSFFTRWVDYDFTANLEEQLDQISNSDIDWKSVLRDFWQDFSAAIGETKELRTTQVLDNLNEILGPFVFPAKPDGTDPRTCPHCHEGKLSLKLGKFGAFIGCSNYPECKFTRQLNQGNSEAVAGGETPGQRNLGADPATGLDITLREGRFGPYLQLGEGEKPKRSSLPKGLSPAELDLAKAILLLSLPREIARHPTSGEPILAGIGKFGPYVQHGRTYANLGADDDVLEIGGNRAIDLIVAKESGAGGRFGRAAPSGRMLGDHPTGGAMTVREGRYGPYVNWGKVNATLPKGTAAADLTVAQALELIEAKAGTMPAARSGAAKAAKPAKKAPAKAAASKAPTKAPAKASTTTKAAAKSPKAVDDSVPFEGGVAAPARAKAASGAGAPAKPAARPAGRKTA